MGPHVDGGDHVLVNVMPPLLHHRGLGLGRRRVVEKLVSCLQCGIGACCC
jgi:hypothetical protein